MSFKKKGDIMSHNPFRLNYRILGIFLIIFLSSLLLGKESKQAVSQTGLSIGEKADIQRIIGESRPGQPTPLDFSKEHHYRFFKSQLRQAGITKELFPQMFKVLEQARQKHLKSGPPDVYRPKVPSFKQDQSESVSSTANTVSGVGPIQQITSLGSKNGSYYQASALSSVPNQPYVSLLILGLYTMAADPIGPTKFVKQYMSGEDLVVETNGTLLKGGKQALSIASYYYQDKSGTPYYGHIHAATSIAPVSSINNYDPRIIVQGNTEIVVCLGRAWGNCDYAPEGGSGTNVLLPIRGSITYPGNIDQVQPGNSNVFSSITLTRPDPGDGGGCTITSTDDFFEDPNTKIVGNTLSWDLAPAHFGSASGCLVPNSTAIYTFMVMVQINEQPIIATITNAPDVSPTDPNSLIIPDMLIVFSCLPDGTRVLLADGTEKAIEKIAPLEKVVSDSSNRTMTVHSSLKGKEEIPLVRIKSDKEQSLLLTDGHPVVTPGGVVLARHLKPGDVVLSLKGKVKITSISHERFDGHVWNLVLDPNTKDEKRTEDNSTFYANGILVGDARMQFSWGRHFKQQPQDVMKRLPKEWHQDFLNYRMIKEQKKSNQR